MKNPRYRHLEQVARNGEFVAKWLNGDGWGYSTEVQKRTISLLEKLGELRVKAIQRLPVERSEITAVNELLHHYPWVLDLSGFTTSGVPFFARSPAPDTHQEGQTWLGFIVQIMGEGLLDRLRRCSYCGAWFYANRPKGKFHSADCRQAYFRSTDEYREKNRKYQRKYYRDWRSAATAKQAKERKGKRHAKKR